MIAIPVDSIDVSGKSSKLFGNVGFFALYDTKGKQFTFVENKGSGNGIKTAEFLSEHKVSKVVYSYMGDGPFKTLIKNNIDVFHIDKEPLALYNVIQGMQNSSFIQVNAQNAADYLDPGNATGNCECGCSHD